MSERVTIDQLLARARSRLERVVPANLTAEAHAGALIVDIRPADQRLRDGPLPGSVVIDRNVLEWRLDPTSPDRLAEVSGYDQRIVLVCNEGYSSSLAAATLQDLGLHQATDVVGGYQAWRAATVESIPGELLPSLDIVIDCADPETLAQFWAEALSYTKAGLLGSYFVLLAPLREHPRVILQHVPEPQTARPRIHLHVRVADIETDARRLEALGAQRIERGEAPAPGRITMTDPEGNEFCVWPGGQLPAPMTPEAT